MGDYLILYDYSCVLLSVLHPPVFLALSLCQSDAPTYLRGSTKGPSDEGTDRSAQELLAVDLDRVWDTGRNIFLSGRSHLWSATLVLPPVSRFYSQHGKGRVPTIRKYLVDFRSGVRDQKRSSSDHSQPPVPRDR